MTDNLNLHTWRLQLKCKVFRRSCFLTLFHRKWAKSIDEPLKSHILFIVNRFEVQHFMSVNKSSEKPNVDIWTSYSQQKLTYTIWLSLRCSEDISNLLLRHGGCVSNSFPLWRKFILSSFSCTRVSFVLSFQRRDFVLLSLLIKCCHIEILIQWYRNIIRFWLLNLLFCYLKSPLTVVHFVGWKSY